MAPKIQAPIFFHVSGINVADDADEQNQMNLGSDAPKTDPADDAFGYSPFAKRIADAIRRTLRELETTAMTKSFKMVLLEAFQELNGWNTPPTTAALADRSWQVLQRRRVTQVAVR